MLKFLILVLFIFFPLAYCKQFYDRTPCASPDLPPGSRYECTTSSRKSCTTYIVYRSRGGFNTVSNLENLFSMSSDQVLRLNNLSDPLQVIEDGRDVLLPIRCSCAGGFYQSKVSYVTCSAITYTKIACEAFEGLVKMPALAAANDYNASVLPAGLELDVPIRCACPDKNDAADGFRFLVSYPLQEYDEILLLARKFNTSVNDIFLQNSLLPVQTIYPNTTILIPVRNVPAIQWNISSNTSDGIDNFIPITTGATTGTKRSRKHKYVMGIVISVLLLTGLLLALVFYGKSLYKNGRGEHKQSPVRKFATSLFSTLFIEGMAKYSLKCYTVEQLRDATRCFGEDTRLGPSVHKGTFDGSKVVIEKVAHGDARRVVDIHLKINHSNIVKLDGVCYGDKLSASYLVFEFVEKGCLSDCLRNSKEEIPWYTRMQIAFDVAVGLHYIHHCTIPSFIHTNITSKNILITGDWRAKIANLGASAVGTSQYKDGSKGLIAPEYLHQGSVSTKVDVYSFGVVLFEILSAKDARDCILLKESSSFLGGGGVTGFDQIRRIVDPKLKDYPIGEAMCLSVLAKACLEEDPTLRPSMNDILMILARMESLYSVRSK